MRVLFLSRWYPYPANNGSKLRVLNLLQGLAKWHEVTLVSFSEQAHTTAHPPELLTICQQIHVVHWKPYWPRSWRACLGYLSPKPRSVVDTYSAELEHCIAQVLSQRHFDLIIASQSNMAMYSAHFRGIPAILEELELGTLQDQYSQAKGLPRWRYGLTWQKHKRWVAKTLKDFATCTLVSETERKLARRAVPHYHAFEVIPNCVRVDEYRDVREEPKRNSLVFTGAFSYRPNYDAMCWFISEVLPFVQRELPDVELTITGNNDSYDLPPARNVYLTGYVDDVRGHIARSWASVVPIRYGGGTRLKILESVALKTPVVATSKGVEGLELYHEQHVLVADTPDEFARAVVRLLTDPVLRQRLVEAAYAVVRELYDWDVVLPRFLSLTERVVTEAKQTQHGR